MDFAALPADLKLKKKKKTRNRRKCFLMIGFQLLNSEDKHGVTLIALLILFI